MNIVLEVLVSALIVIGAGFVLVGSWGMVRLPDLMSRLHAPTKATTLGVGGALLASMLFFFGVNKTLSVHELLITLFLFLSAPITAHFLSKAYMHRHVDPEKTLPRPGHLGWSTYEAAPGAGDGQPDEAQP